MLQPHCAAYPLMATKAAQHVYHIINAVTARLPLLLCSPPAASYLCILRPCLLRCSLLSPRRLKSEKRSKEKPPDIFGV